MAADAFSRSDIGAKEPNRSSGFFQTKPIAIIVTCCCSRNDVMLPDPKNSDPNAFHDFSSGNMTEY